METEVKKEYMVYANNPLLVKFWDLEHMRGTANYSVCMFKNINYSGSPSRDLTAYYCNSSYRTVSAELPNDGASDATANMTGNVLLMHMDETSGPIVDYSGEGNNGTVHDGVAYGADGKINTSLSYDGAGDYVSVVNDPTLKITGPITLAAWVNFDSLGATSDWKGLVAKWNHTAQGGSGWGYGLFKASGTNQIAFITASAAGGGYADAQADDPPALNTWYHVVGTYDGSIMRLYINGELQTATGTQSSIYDNDEPVTIGTFETNNNFWLNGTIDEVAIWNRSLSGNEVLDIYKRGVMKASEDTDNCVLLDAFNTTDLDDIYYTSKNSSYSKSCFSTNTSEFGGIEVTDTFFMEYESETTPGNNYVVRYANGSSGTNVSFNESNVAWSSANNVVNWTQAQFTPDLWFSTIKGDDQFQLGVYVENSTGTNYTIFSLYTEDIGYANHNITKPSIRYYQSASGETDYDLDGTYAGNMTVHVEMAKDMNGLGTVTHNLTLRHPDGSWYYTINDSFKSSDDSDVDIEFDTRDVLNGRYRMKVTAVADDNPNDVELYLTPNNFTADNPTYVNETHWWRCGAEFNASLTPITAAVENATSSETIYVFDGGYENEHANVNKSHLTLQGESVAGVNVAATASGEHVFNVTEDWVNITWFNVSGATGSGKAGFYLNGVEHCDISGNNVSGNYYGIYLNSAGNNTVIGNTAESNTEYGIYLNNTARNNTLRANIVAKNKDGIYLNNAGSNNISCNWLYYNNRTGFNLTGGSTGNNISHNNIVENGAHNGSSGGREWQFYINQTDPVTATHNWWGTNENATINDSIYDWYRDNTKGNVTVFPRLYQPDPCAPIPEISTVILVGVGLVVLAGYLRIRRRRR